MVNCLFDEVGRERDISSKSSSNPSRSCRYCEGNWIDWYLYKASWSRFCHPSMLGSRCCLPSRQSICLIVVNEERDIVVTTATSDKMSHAFSICISVPSNDKDFESMIGKLDGLSN